VRLLIDASESMTLGEPSSSTTPAASPRPHLCHFLTSEDIEKPLQYLAEFGHELMLLQVWSPEDREPPWDGELALQDAESDAHIEIDFDDETRQHYTASFDEYAESLRKLAYRHGGRYVGLATSVPVEEAIFGPIAMVEGVR
jgi:hypothetical protein